MSNIANQWACWRLIVWLKKDANIIFSVFLKNKEHSFLLIKPWVSQQLVFIWPKNKRGRTKLGTIFEKKVDKRNYQGHISQNRTVYHKLNISGFNKPPKSDYLCKRSRWNEMNRVRHFTIMSHFAAFAGNKLRSVSENKFWNFYHVSCKGVSFRVIWDLKSFLSFLVTDITSVAS